jgi:hypothetical protein
VTSATPAPDLVSTAEIAGLLAWARSLSQAGGSADPAERTAFLAAKTALLARITDQHPTQPPQGTPSD